MYAVKQWLIYSPTQCHHHRAASPDKGRGQGPAVFQSRSRPSPVRWNEHRRPDPITASHAVMGSGRAVPPEGLGYAETRTVQLRSADIQQNTSSEEKQTCSIYCTAAADTPRPLPPPALATGTGEHIQEMKGRKDDFAGSSLSQRGSSWRAGRMLAASTLPVSVPVCWKHSNCCSSLLGNAASSQCEGWFVSF